MVESSLPDGWSLDVSYNGSTLTVGVSNWSEATPIGTNNLFKVNCIVNDEANLNDLVTVSTNVILQVDKWGNNGVPFVNGTGTILIDGTFAPKGLKNYRTIIKGDEKIKCISAASIVAKTYRDLLMIKLSKKFKYYAWERNYGYGTRDHMEGLKKFGITPHHRKGFKPIYKMLSS